MQSFGRHAFDKPTNGQTVITIIIRNGKKREGGGVGAGASVTLIIN